MAATIAKPNAVPLRKVRASLAALRAGKSGGHAYLTLLGMPALDTSELIARINKGFPFSAWELFTQVTELPTEAAASAVQVPLRTLSRRKEEGRLHADESDRLVRVARIFMQALELFNGDTEATRRWLTSPQSALAGAKPLDYAATEVGAREVESLIGRLEHGIPS